MAIPGQPGGAGYTDAEAVSAVEASDPLTLAGDVTIDGAKSLAVDVIDEKDTDAGVTIETVVIKDGLVDGVDVSAISGGGPTFAVKTADETVASSTTLQDDDHLSLAVGTNEVWAVEFYLSTLCFGSVGFRYAFTGPAGMTGRMNSVAYDDGQVVSVQSSTNLTSALLHTTVSNMDRVRVTLLLRTAGTAGTLQFKWAQETSGVGDCTIFADSYMIAHQVS